MNSALFLSTLECDLIHFLLRILGPLLNQVIENGGLNRYNLDRYLPTLKFNALVQRFCPL